MDVMRWRYGETKQVRAPVPSDVRIEIGDLLWWDVDHAKPASLLRQALAIEARDDLAFCFELQRRFARLFLGVAMERSRRPGTEPIRVATSGVFEFDAHGGIAILGALAGVELAPCGTQLRNQRLTLVGRADRAIGRIAVQHLAPQTKLWVAISSRVMAPVFAEELA